jgi:hypothetical protein
MSNTYDKLGKYADSELPSAIINLVVGTVDNTTIALSWTNNNTAFTAGKVVIQTWQGTYWETKVIRNYNTTTGNLTSLSEGTSYRIRVAFLLDGVLYPSNPLTQVTTNIPKPENFTVTDYDDTTITLAWDGYDESWEAVIVQRYISGAFTDVATLDATATTYTYTGLTQNTTYYLTVASVIDGVTYSAYPPTYKTQKTAREALLPLENIGFYPSEVENAGHITVTWTNPNSYETLGGRYTLSLGVNCGGFTNTRDNIDYALSEAIFDSVYFISDGDISCQTESYAFSFETDYTLTVIYTSSDGRKASGSTTVNVTLAIPDPIPSNLYFVGGDTGWSHEIMSKDGAIFTRTATFSNEVGFKLTLTAGWDNIVDGSIFTITGGLLLDYDGNFQSTLDTDTRTLTVDYDNMTINLS